MPGLLDEGHDEECGDATDVKLLTIENDVLLGMTNDRRNKITYPNYSNTRRPRIIRAPTLNSNNSRTT